jgi:hypothetical protein
VVQFITALFVGFCASWFAGSAWFPVIDQAVARLPDTGMIRDGQLDWHGPSPVWLAEGRYLSVVVNVDGAASLGQSCDLQVELTRTHFRVRSLFGYVATAYPADWKAGLNRKEAVPWWGAWRPFFRLGIGAGVGAGLWLSWFVLAWVYMVPVRLIAFYADRELTLGGAWKLASAALTPPALMMGGAILLYGTLRLNLVGLLFAWLLHVVIGWIYLGIAPFRLPRLPGVPPRKKDPFTNSRKKKSRRSPFKR